MHFFTSVPNRNPVSQKPIFSQGQAPVGPRDFPARVAEAATAAPLVPHSWLLVAREVGKNRRTRRQVQPDFKKSFGCRQSNLTAGGRG